MKEIIYLLVGMSMVALVGIGLMRGTENIENSSGDGTIDQQTLSDSLRETIAPTQDIIPTDTPDDEDDDDGPIETLAPGDVAD